MISREFFVGAVGFGTSRALSLSVAEISQLGSLVVAAVTVAYLLRRWQLLERSRRAACAECPKRPGLIFPKDG